MRKYRIGVAFFYHETHTFSPKKTSIEDFKAEGFYKEQEIISAYTDTNTEVGGFIDQLEKLNYDIVPIFCGAAIPSGMVTANTRRMVHMNIIEHMEAGGKIDGLLIALHGAMVAEDAFDPEGELLQHIRRIVGEELPICTTLDMHANVSEDMIKSVPFQFGFKTYPHVDMFEQGVNAAKLMDRLVVKKEIFHASFVKLPMMPPSINMRTSQGPMHDLVELAKECEKEDDIINASIFGGFPYADIPIVGAGVLVISQNKLNGDKVAIDLAEEFWKRRNDFIKILPNVEEAIEEAIAVQGKSRVAIVDISDNPLSGGSGDTTLLLKEMINRQLQDSLCGGIYDPVALDNCVKAGIGAELELDIGGRTSPEFGEPLKVRAKVCNLTDGVFTNKGPMNNGMKVDVKGAAHVNVGVVDILIIGRAISANDPELFRHIGIEPIEKKVLALKAKNHFRAAFDDLVEKVIYVDAPGIATNNFTNLTYHHIPRPMWPFEEFSFQAKVTNLI